MKKSVKITLLVILLIILVITAVLVIAGVYFYYYHVFKEVKICIPNEAMDIPMNCTSNDECQKLLEKGLNQVREQIKDAPPSIKEFMDTAIEKSVYCENTCKAKMVYSNLMDETITDCKQGDEELVYQIRGKEGIELLKYISENKELLEET